jgi:hypothetical protein
MAGSEKTRDCFGYTILVLIITGGLIEKKTRDLLFSLEVK